MISWKNSNMVYIESGKRRAIPGCPLPWLQRNRDLTRTRKGDHDYEENAQRVAIQLL
jgi:hypothetical protein